MSAVLFEIVLIHFRFFVHQVAGRGFISPKPTGVLGRAGRQLGFSCKSQRNEQMQIKVLEGVPL